jgi:hypothetical protein
MRRHKTSDEFGVTRRDFFKNAGAGLVAAELAGASPTKAKAGPAAAPVHFTPQGGLTRISPNLYLPRDSTWARSPKALWTSSLAVEGVSRKAGDISKEL